MNDVLIKHTLLRTHSVVRAQADADDSLHLAGRGKSLQHAIPVFLQMMNGDWRLPCCTHYCNGCCRDERGVVTFEQQVDNIVAALIGVGLFGGVQHVVPAKSRWLSTAKCLATLTAGMLVHSVLPRAWSLVEAEHNVLNTQSWY